MENQLPKRKRLPHFPSIDRHNQPNIHLITVCTKNRRPVLACDLMHQILRTAWQAADSFRVGRYVLMPDHLHLFCTPVQIGPDYLEPWIRYWKSLTTRQHPAMEKGGLWQRDFWDTQMRNAENYATQWDYIWLNPVRSGLVSDPDEWPYKGEMHPCGWDN
jgi:REP element-mobilizing transposase RayT